MNLTRWKDGEVPDFEGIVDASGHAFTLANGRLSPAELPQHNRTLLVGVLASREIFSGRYRVKCGEAAQHGSIGVIVLEDSESGNAVWSFASEESNPFDQVEDKGSYVIVLSTSGAVFRFRFREKLEDVALFLP